MTLFLALPLKLILCKRKSKPDTSKTHKSYAMVCNSWPLADGIRSALLSRLELGWLGCSGLETGLSVFCPLPAALVHYISATPDSKKPFDMIKNSLGRCIMAHSYLCIIMADFKRKSVHRYLVRQFWCFVIIVAISYMLLCLFLTGFLQWPVLSKHMVVWTWRSGWLAPIWHAYCTTDMETTAASSGSIVETLERSSPGVQDRKG